MNHSRNRIFRAAQTAERKGAVLLYHFKGSGNFLDRRALGRMDESPDRREGAVVRLDYDRCQRHDA